MNTSPAGEPLTGNNAATRLQRMFYVLGMLPVLKIDSVMILMVPSILPMHSSRNFGKEVRNEP